MTPADEKAVVIAEHEATRTSINNQDSPLLRLPAELRNSIYEYVFSIPWIRACHARHIHRLLPCTESLNHPTNSIFHFHYPRQLLALTETCREIHNETKVLPFALNELQGDSYSIDKVLNQHLSLDQQNALTTICLLNGDDGLNWSGTTGQSMHMTQNLHRMRLSERVEASLCNIRDLPNVKRFTFLTGHGIHRVAERENMVERYKEAVATMAKVWLNQFKLDAPTEVKVLFPYEYEHSCGRRTCIEDRSKRNGGNSAVECSWG